MNNMEIVRRFTVEFLGRADLSAADVTLHPDIRCTTGLKPTGPIKGLDEYKATLTGFVDAFPAEGPIEIVDQFESADGLRVVTRFHSRQRHTKDYFGIAATGRVILFDETHVARLKDGKIIENVVSATNLEFEMLMAPALSPMILAWSG
jgi:predicted ester cyclase